MAAVLYNRWGFRKVQFFNVYKAIWYVCTALSVYWLVHGFYSNGIVALMAALLFVAVTATPNTLFFLTYGEHFLILPVNLSLIFSYEGVLTGNPWFFLWSGLMAGWAVQLKPTAILFGAILLASYGFLSDPLIPILCYLSVFIGLNLLPLFLLRAHGGKAINHYILLTFGPFIIFPIMLLEQMHLHFYRRFTPAYLQDKQYQAYIKSHQEKNISSQLLSFKRFMLPAIKDLRMILILAVVQVVFLFWNFDFFVYIMMILCFVFLLTQQLQKNYYTPHMNPCWMPVSVLAAKTLYDIVPMLYGIGVWGWLLLLLVGTELARVSWKIVRSFASDQRDVMGYMGPLLGVLFRYAQTIGRYIQQNSPETDKLFVWGDHPSIYLYSEREAFHSDYLFLYAHQRRIHNPEEIRKLIALLRDDPPEWILFYNYKFNDGWHMKSLSDAIGIPYVLRQDFRVNDPVGRTMRISAGVDLEFPLYRRDDRLYKEILLDKAIVAGQGRGGMQSYLKRILQILPNDYETLIRLGWEESGGSNIHEFLEGEWAKATEGQRAILLRLLAETDLREGRVENALRGYMKACESDPCCFRTYNGLSDVCLHMGKDGEAFQFSIKANEINKFSVDAYNNLGVIHARQGQWDDAVACFRKVLSIIPGHPDAVNNINMLGLSMRL